MQLSVQLPHSCVLECTHSLDASTISSLDGETSSNASCDDCSPSWVFAASTEATAAEEMAGGPPTRARCSPHQPQHGQQQQDKRSVYRRLTLSVPCSTGDGVAQEQQQQLQASCATSTLSSSSARRVLCTSGSYSSVCSWLEQQVSSRMGAAGNGACGGNGLLAACSNMVVDLDSCIEAAPATPATLPAPAFQLLGLL